MERPTMFESYRVAPDIEVLPSFFPIPGLGILPINAFLLWAKEPVLIDTGVAVLGDQFMAQLEKVIDPGDLGWLWITHCDQDHIGSLQRILEASPGLRVITNFLATGKMSLFNPLPLERLYWLNPGQEIKVGDRILRAIKPPTYDAPETTGAYDAKSGAFFSADCFGALMSEPKLAAADIDSNDLQAGLVAWAKVDSPWLHAMDSRQYAKTLDAVRRMAPRLILSSHLPAAQDMTDQLLQYLAAAPAGEPFMGPDQEGLAAILNNADAG